MFPYASPIDFNTAVTTVWPQSETQWRHDPSFVFKLLAHNQEVNQEVRNLSWYMNQHYLVQFKIYGKVKEKIRV